MDSLSEISTLVSHASSMGHHTHLQRVKSETAFKELYASMKSKLTESDRAHVVSILGETLILMMESQKWEIKFGGINLAIHLTSEGDCDPSLTERILEQCDSLYLDKEFRIRNQVAPLLHTLIKQHGPKIYERFIHKILQNIEETFVREDKIKPEDVGSLKGEALPPKQDASP